VIIPALRDPNATMQQKATYLNYMWSVRDPQLISTEYPIRVYGFFLIGRDRYTEKDTFRLIRLTAGAPFGPGNKMAEMGLAW
jgi:hypothetical protein